MKITVVGTGYVGLVSGVCLAEMGHDVTCVDTDHAKINKLHQGQSPIFEPGLEALLKNNLAHDRLLFTADLAPSLQSADFVFIAVGTPPGEDGSADLSYVLQVADSVGRYLQTNRKTCLHVVVKSTVPVGTCDQVEARIRQALAQRGEMGNFSVSSNPEFLKEGAAIDDFMHPDRIIVGTDHAQAAHAFRELYLPFVIDDPAKLLLMDRRSSELTKYAANAMLAVRISFMNELSRLCDSVGADIDNIRRGMGADLRIGRKFLYAGPGYGGSCFPKDVEALVRTAEGYQISLEVVKAASTANERQKDYVAMRIKQHYGDLRGKRVAVWGLAFKPGTDDVREAPAKVIIEKLLDWGAVVIGHDPEAIENFSREIGERPGLSYAKTSYEALKAVDMLVLITEWSEYKRPNLQKVKALMRHPTVFDFRNQYGRASMEGEGFVYHSLGRPLVERSHKVD